MKAVAKEHSDVTKRLQTQTVNSTLWVACHHHQLPRESYNTWLSQPSAQHQTTANQSHLPTPTSHSLPDMYRLVWRWVAVAEIRMESKPRLIPRSGASKTGHMLMPLYHSRGEVVKFNHCKNAVLNKEKEFCLPSLTIKSVEAIFYKMKITNMKGVFS